MDVFEELDIEVRVIISYRNPLEVAASLKKRDNMSLSKSLLLWADAIFKAEKFTRSLPRVFLNYSSLLNNTISSIQQISKKLNLQLRITKDQKIILDTFIEKRLQHFTENSLNEKQEIPEQIRRLADLILAIDLRNTNPQEQKQFDVIYQKFYSRFRFFNGIDPTCQILLKTFDTNGNDNKYSVEANPVFNKVLFSLDPLQPITSFLFFPANQRVAIQVIALLIVTAEGENKSVSISNSNAEKTSDDGTMVFESEFPWIRIDLEAPMSISEVHLEFRFLAFASYTYRSSIKERNNYEFELLSNFAKLQKNKQEMSQANASVIENFKTQISSLSQKANDQLTAHESKVTKLDSMIVELMQKSEAATIQHNAAIKKLEENTQQLHEQYSLVSKHKAEIENLNERIELLEVEIEQQHTNIKQLVNEHTAAIALKNETIEENNTAHLSTLNSLKEESKTLSSELNIKSEQLYLALNSMSWKIGRTITWPARKMKNLFKPGLLSKRVEKNKSKNNNGHYGSGIKKLIKRIIWFLGKGLFSILPLSTESKEKLKQFSYKNFGHFITSVKNKEKSAYPTHVISESSTLRNKDAERQAAFVPWQANEPLKDSVVKVLAFYLPQFHTIPENDEWWGAGFTEWTNVKPAKPQFKGHYQPHFPGNLGYYDLQYAETFVKQIELAKNYGIGGFCFHFYWFDGKRLLEKPILNYLENSQFDFPFCLSWANENWTRRWDGREKDILIQQNHSPEDDIAFIQYVSKYLKDKRYIRIDNKPLLMVYRPSLLPSAKETGEIWRTWCRNNGIGEIYLAYVQSFERVHPDIYGYDAAIEFPPNIFSPENATHLVEAINEDFKCNVYDWESMVSRSDSYSVPEYKLFRGACPSWDNTPRRKNESTIFINSNPGDFKRWIYNASVDTLERFENPDERLVFVNAWNEWAEGAYLEPDSKYGCAYLNAVKEAQDELIINESISKTYYFNNQIYLNRINEIKKIFSADKIDNNYLFLVDYLKLLELINRAYPHSLRIAGGLPAFVFKDEFIEINGRGDLYEIYKRALQTKNDTVFSFVILQYNNSEQTIECVNSIKNLRDDRIRIIIVDNASESIERSRLEGEYNDDPSVKVIFNEKNLGFAAGNNVGYKYAKTKLKSDFIALVNNDTVVNQESFIIEALQIFEELSYSILGPDIQIPDGRHENPYNDYIFNHHQSAELIEIREREKRLLLEKGEIEWENYRVYSPEKDIILNPILQGAALILSPIFINDNELVFEEITFLYGEEFVLAANSLIKGDLPVYTNRVKIQHKEGKSTDSLDLQKKMLHGYNGAIQSLKHSIGILNKDEKQDLIVVHQEELTGIVFANKKKILYDILFSQGGIHGGGEYGKAVFKELAQKVNKLKDRELWVVANPESSIDEWVWDIIRSNRIKVIPVKDFDSIAQIVNLGLFDTFFTPALVMYSDGYEYMKSVGKNVKLHSTKTRIIGTLHDIRDFELDIDIQKTLAHRKNLKCLPEYKLSDNKSRDIIQKRKVRAEELRTMYARLCESNSIDCIITVSEYSKNAIITKITDCHEKLKVFYAPMKHRADAQPFKEVNNNIKKDKFALIVNASRTEKNTAAAIKAIDNIFTRKNLPIELSDDFTIVVTGVNNIKDVYSEKLANPQRFIILPHLPAENLEYLYENAKLLIFPSLSEGFGYPPIEAMSYGTQCLVSNVTSIPEVCGDAAVYVDPYNIESIENGIIEAVSNGLPSEIIQEQYLKVTKRQNSDLNKLVELITQ